MSLLKKIFGKKENPIITYDDFWNWFLEHEKSFFKIVKKGKNIEKDFFDKLSPKLDELNDGFLLLTGMYDDNTAELIITPDGIIKNIVFVEELVNVAPQISGWKFTALKPPTAIDKFSINMSAYIFDTESLFFYPNDNPNYPDEIDISIVHLNYKEEDKSIITNGIYIFLDNYLGELNAVTTIDNLRVIGKPEAEKELIPIDKLKAFLIWRQKEFLEKYEGERYDTENDNYSSMEAKLKNGSPLIAIINTTLLEWDCKASHPWILNFEMKYDGCNYNGMPDPKTYEFLNSLENEVIEKLKDFDGYLNIGRETAENSRKVFFACKDFRKPSIVMYELTKKYSDRIEISYEIYKDKYWQTFDRFIPD
ncbi:MAG: DUF695 domain-containing protein [Bacteroidales bacterium]